MSAPLYSLEEALERSVVTTLQGITALSNVAIVTADRSQEVEIPFISIRAERQDEVVLGMKTYNATLAATLTTAADETSDEERDARRLPDPEDDDEGADGFKTEWKALTDALGASGLPATLNSQNLVHVWGIEQQPVSYENNERTFARTVNLRVWCNEAYETPSP